MITLKRKLICVALEVLVKFFLSPKETRKQDSAKNILLFTVWERC